MVEVAAERGKRSSSRTSEEGAGWRCQQIGSYKGLRPNTDTFSWFHPRTLWRSRNEILAGLFGDPSGQVRRRWVEAQRARGVDGDFRIRPGVGKSFSFLLLGDPGEGDDSQYAVVPGMLHVGADTSFAVIASDVVYPTGAGNEYCDKFFRPYKDYQAPVYAIPGNHDWYDGLGGFMRVFCDAPPLKPRPDRAARAAVAQVGADRRAGARRGAQAARRPLPAGGAARPLLGHREREPADRGGRHRHQGGHRRRADRVAAPYLARPPAEDPHHRQADLHARRPQAFGPGGRGHHRRHRPRPRAPLRRGDRR
ncbi:metallophosphoesterase [Nonomuraea recticatena]|uniref:metallophosphoesterase n=1 Tax=Nonomuraea recticatena TaxID=46178 RepID=UPI0036149AE2